MAQLNAYPQAGEDEQDVERELIKARLPLQSVFRL
jgi:hypothetical protein